MSLKDVEQLLRQLTLGPAPHAELLRVPMLPDFDRARVIGEYRVNSKTRTFSRTRRSSSASIRSSANMRN